MQHDPRLVRNARRLRHDLTPAEEILWPQLRGRRFGGYRFRRQHVIDPYIIDFYCATAALVVELDGETHLGREEEDRIRQAFLEGQGLKVLRFWNTEVFEDLEAVLEMIYRECEKRALIPPRPQVSRRRKNPSPPTPLPSGERGERRGPLPSREGRKIDPR